MCSVYGISDTVELLREGYPIQSTLGTVYADVPKYSRLHAAYIHIVHHPPSISKVITTS